MRPSALRDQNLLLPRHQRRAERRLRRQQQLEHMEPPADRAEPSHSVEEDEGFRVNEASRVTVEAEAGPAFETASGRAGSSSDGPAQGVITAQPQPLARDPEGQGTSMQEDSDSRPVPEAAPTTEEVGVQVDLEQLQRVPDCLICSDRSRSTILLPCAHVLLCQECADDFMARQARQCPVCREPFVLVQNIFF